jgi:hypothetical protein
VLVLPFITYDFQRNERGDSELSILLDTPILRTKEITRSQHGEPKTSSILLISVAITMAIVLLMFTGLTYTEARYEQFYMQG